MLLPLKFGCWRTLGDIHDLRLKYFASPHSPFRSGYTNRWLLLASNLRTISHTAMASKGAVLPLLRREIRPSRFSRATSSVSAITTPARHSSSSFTASGLRSTRRTALFTAPIQTRAFSQSLSKRFTNENGDFDPRILERESDDVDVCIVGGGTCFVPHRFSPEVA